MSRSTPYRVELAPVAQRQLRTLPPGAGSSARGPILGLAVAPRTPSVTKLVGSDYWRIRVGDVRVVYLIDGAARLVIVIRVARRDESTHRRL